MTQKTRFLLAAVFTLAVSACGQSGPLYLPGNPSQVQEPAQAPHTTDEDDDEKRENEG